MQDQERYQEGEQDPGEEDQGKVFDFDCGIPLYALSFSNKSFLDRNNRESQLMAVGSYLQ